MDVASRADLLRETAEHHGEFEAVAPPHDWWDWYAAYMIAREGGSSGRGLRDRGPLHGGGEARRRREELAMSTTDASPSNNSQRFAAWSQSWTHFSVDRHSAGYCRVTFDHPPINTITATTVAELAELVGLIEQDADLNVVVFDSANPDFYLADYDTEEMEQDAWLDLLVRLSRAPVVSIASIRGRVRGAGSEFVLACDLRFASRENALLGQFEVGTGCRAVLRGRWSVAAGRSRCCSWPTSSTGRAPSCTGTSTG